jgi:CyaY protein
MTESEFLEVADRTLASIERALEHAADNDEVDIECNRAGNVLEVEFIDSGAKIIVNSQAPMQEIWLAAKAGGFHYKRLGNAWVDTRSGEELFAALSRLVSDQAGQAIALDAHA